MEGVIFNIQRFSVQDGPGIRTTVFFKGCPLRCRWCHNPESQHTAREIAYHTDKCIGCGACGAVCPSGAHRFEEGRHVFLRERCTACGRCAEVCCAQALEAIGRRAPVEEVLREVLADKEFYAQSGGEGGGRLRLRRNLRLRRSGDPAAPGRVYRHLPV